MDIYREMLLRLQDVYDEGEARAVAFLVLETAFGITRTDVYADKDRDFSAEERQVLQNILSRLLHCEPVQYVLGEAWFDGLRLNVTPATLIPRPETEELVRLVRDYARLRYPDGAFSVLDAGTGSGCIAIALKHRFPAARVAAWDNSAEALAVARKNARQLGTEVAFSLADILADPPVPNLPLPLLLVSNPPYVCQHEAEEMLPQVRDYEPGTALFVPDDDPLHFYRALSRIGRKSEAEAVFLEVNRAYAEAVATLLRQDGWAHAEVHRDAFDNARFVVGKTDC
ncbi:MAG: peptide chain release factor N(5)-glutamine methyltransferase [Alloprevotella sp.]|nr:peptide chain release factor N(5)-glutamine methyltransferase [Alloprevotella sp.]